MEKAMEIDLDEYIASYLKDEYLADIEYKDKLVKVEIEYPIIKKKDNGVYCITIREDGHFFRTEEETSEERDSSALKFDEVCYVPTFYVKESELNKLTNLTRKVEIQGVPAPIDKTVFEKEEIYRTLFRWFKKVKIKYYDEYYIEVPFKECTITPIMETFSFGEYVNYHTYSLREYTHRCSVILTDVDKDEGKTASASRKVDEDDPNDDRYYTILFNFSLPGERSKVKKLSPGDNVVIEGKSIDSVYCCNMVSCRIIE